MMVMFELVLDIRFRKQVESIIARTVHTSSVVSKFFGSLARYQARIVAQNDFLVIGHYLYV